MEPFLAAGKLLEASGHEVHCQMPAQFGELVRASGLNFHPFDPRFLELLETEAGRGIMGQKGSGWQRLHQLFDLARQSLKLQSILKDEQRSLIRQLAPDRLIYHPKIMYARLWGMEHPNRSWMLSPVPNILHPTNDFPHIGINAHLGKFGNRLTFSLIGWATALAIQYKSKPYQPDFPNTRLSFAAINRHLRNRERVVYPLSSSLYPRPEEWPDRAQLTGYLERPKKQDFNPTPELAQFVTRHSGNLLAVTFGSMVNAKPEATTDIILRAVKRLNVPTVLVTSSGGLLATQADNAMLKFVKEIPYDWLFPHCKAVVHHGGSGTTHTALRYGCASLIIPHIIDQFFWNRLIARRGIGPLGPSVGHLQQEPFTELLTELLNQSAYRHAAQAIGKNMQQEDAEANFLRVVSK